MKAVVLVGTDHKFQRPVNGSEPEIENFRDAIRELCLLHNVRAIAEEMNLQALQNTKIRSRSLINYVLS